MDDVRRAASVIERVERGATRRAWTPGVRRALIVVSVFFIFRWIDGFGRRKLAMGGYTGMTVFALIAALGLAATSTGWPASGWLFIGAGPR